MGPMRVGQLGTLCPLSPLGRIAAGLGEARPKGLVTGTVSNIGSIGASNIRASGRKNTSWNGSLQIGSRPSPFAVPVVLASRHVAASLTRDGPGDVPAAVTRPSL
jgi:hypothetical protein